MKITWYGHSCFLIEAEEGRILTDPFDTKVPYDFPASPVDIVTVSHDHFDHNAVDRVAGRPIVVKGRGKTLISSGSARFTTIGKGQSAGRTRYSRSPLKGSGSPTSAISEPPSMISRSLHSGISGSSSSRWEVTSRSTLQWPRRSSGGCRASGSSFRCTSRPIGSRTGRSRRWSRSQR